LSREIAEGLGALRLAHARATRDTEGNHQETAGKRGHREHRDDGEFVFSRFIRCMEKQRFGEKDDPLTYAIIGCAIKVHKKLGPGLIESPYDDCMQIALTDAGLRYRHQPSLRIPYEGRVLDRNFRPDFLIEDQVVLEIKSVEHFLPVHQAQVLTYMRLAEIQRGLLINFNVALLVNGIKRLILTEAPIGAPVVP
jgi:GxxExxY protein